MGFADGDWVGDVWGFVSGVFSVLFCFMFWVVRGTWTHTGGVHLGVLYVVIEFMHFCMLLIRLRKLYI